MEDIRKEFEKHIMEAPGRLVRWLKPDIAGAFPDAWGREGTADPGEENAGKAGLVFAAALPFGKAAPDMPENAQVVLKTDVSAYGGLADFLKDCAGALRPGGQVMLCVHNVLSRQHWNEDWTRFVQNHVFGGRSPAAEGGISGTDIVCTREELGQAADAAGLEVRKIYYPSPDWYETTDIYTDEWLSRQEEERHMNPEEAPAFIALLGRKGDRRDKQDELLYVKISEQRAPGFRVDTRILRKADGSFSVNKAGAFPQDRAHAERIASLCRDLEDQYRESPLKVNTGWKGAASGTEVEFVTGRTLESRLLDLLDQGREDEAERAADDYLQMLTPKEARRPFACTPEFLYFFGMAPETEEESLTVSDIDIGFDNAIADGKNLQLLDYEWTFHVPVPVRFLYYRALYFFENRHPQCRLLAENLMEKYGINGLARRQFYLMEEFFQKKIGCPPDSFLSLCREMEAFSLTREYSYGRWEREKYQPVLYCNDGIGWSEDQKEPVSYIPIMEGTVDVNLAYLFLAEEEASYRLVIAHLPGLLTVFSLKDQDGREVPYETNGVRVGEGRYFCASGEPAIFPKTDARAAWLRLEWIFDGLAHVTGEDLMDTDGSIKRGERRGERAWDISRELSRGTGEDQDVG